MLYLKNRFYRDINLIMNDYDMIIIDNVNIQSTWDIKSDRIREIIGFYPPLRFRNPSQNILNLY